MIDCRKCGQFHKRTDPCSLPSIATTHARPGGVKRELRPLEELMTVKEVCRIFKISKSQFYRLKEIPRLKIGGSWRVRPSDLQRFLSEQEGSW